MPGIIDLPGWLWRRMPPVAKVGLVVAFVALIAVALLIGPDIRQAKSERERAEQQERLQAREAREARIRREQRPRFVDGDPAEQARRIHHIRPLGSCRVAQRENMSPLR